MKMLQFALMALATVAVSAPPRQGGPANPPTMSAALLSKKIAPGSMVKAQAVITFAPGLHGYQNPPKHELEIPLTLSAVTKGAKITPAYPLGTEIPFAGDTTLAYEGKVIVPFTFIAPKKPGSYSIVVKVRYQQCDSSSCFPPGSSDLTLKYTVVKPLKPSATRSAIAKG